MKTIDNQINNIKEAVDFYKNSRCYSLQTIILNKDSNQFKITKDKKDTFIEDVKYLFLSTEENKKRKYNINHIIDNKNYYRILYFRNFNDFSFTKYIDENIYFALQLRRNDDIGKRLIEESKENNIMKEQEEFLETIKEENAYEFSIVLFIKEKTLEDLEDKTKELKRRFAIEEQIELKIKTHLKKDDFYNFYNYKKKLKKVYFENNKILNFTTYKNNKFSTQELLKGDYISEVGYYRGNYFKVFEIEDIELIHLDYKNRKNIFSIWRELLTSFPEEIDAQLIINKELLDKEQIEKEILSKSEMRIGESYNKYLKENIEIAYSSSTDKKIFIVLSIKEQLGVKKNDAEGILERNHNNIKRFEKMLETKIRVLKRNERIEIYKEYFDYDFHNISKKVPINYATEKVEDYISPSSIKQNINLGHNTQAFFASFKVFEFPSNITEELFQNLMKLPYKLNISIRYKFQDKETSQEIIRDKVFAMERYIFGKKEKAEAKRKNVYIPNNFKKIYNESLELQKEIEDNDKKIFMVCITITLFDKTEEELKTKKDMLKSIFKSNMIKAVEMGFKQIDGLLLSSPLPIENTIAKNIWKQMFNNTRFYDKRYNYLISDNLEVFSPFSNINTYNPNGIPYGLTEDNSLIVIDRINNMNSSGWFIGTSGSGKSFLAKKEMTSVILNNPEDEIIIVDPETEYGGLIKEFDGENIKISSNSTHRMNPFDIDLEYMKTKEGLDDLKKKKAFLITFIDTLADGLNQIEKSITDRVITKMYNEYLSGNLKKVGMEVFYERLFFEEEVESNDIAVRIEMYVKGSLDLFVGSTNVNPKKKRICFNISDLEEQSKKIALLIICDFLWRRVAKNKKEGRRTWVYIDEIHLLLKEEMTAIFLVAFYKRVRKYGGVPTAITQNIVDIQGNSIAGTMLSNSEFICILRQSDDDREVLEDVLKLSERQIKAVTNNPAGTGLILTGIGEKKSVIHFKDKMNSNLDIYKLMNTRIGEET